MKAALPRLLMPVVLTVASMPCFADFDFGSDTASSREQAEGNGELGQIIDGLHEALESAAAEDAPASDDVLSDIGTPEYGGDQDRPDRVRSGRRPEINPSISVTGLPGIPLPTGGTPGSGMPDSGGMGLPGSGSIGMPGSMGGGIPAGTNGAGAPSLPGDQSGGKGSRSVAELDRDLDKSLEGFDGIIMDEQQQAKASQPAGGLDESPPTTADRQISMAGSDPGGTEQGVMRGSQPPMPSSRAKREGRSGSAGAPDGDGNAQSESESGENDDEPVSVAQIPDDIQAADNNDIIGRQIQEAALQETDPVLREKLWDEYRRHQASR